MHFKLELEDQTFAVYILPLEGNDYEYDLYEVLESEIVEKSGTRKIIKYITAHQSDYEIYNDEIQEAIKKYLEVSHD